MATRQGIPMIDFLSILAPNPPLLSTGRKPKRRLWLFESLPWEAPFPEVPIRLRVPGRIF